MRLHLIIPRQRRRYLLRAATKVQDGPYRTRLYIVAMVANGGSSTTVAETLGCARSTVIRWVHRYEEAGIAGLIDKREENGVRKVDDGVVRLLRSLISKAPRQFGYMRTTWTRELMGKVVAAKLGIQLSRVTIGRTLRRLGVVWRRARPILLSPLRKGTYSAFKGHLTRWLNAANPDEVILHVDEVDIDLNQKIGFSWMPRGKQSTVRTPGSNRKRYIAGALNPKTGNVVWTVGEKKNTGLFIKLLEEISRRYRRPKTIHLILDNYSPHKSRKVQDYVAGLEGRFRLHFVPAYGQDLNEIEKLWKQVHDNVTRNHKFSSIEDVVAAVEEYIREAIPFPGSSPSLATCSMIEN